MSAGRNGIFILGGPPDARRTLEAAWNQTSAFSNVGVAAMIVPDGSVKPVNSVTKVGLNAVPVTGS